MNAVAIALEANRADERRLRNIGIAIVVTVFFGFGSWAALAPIGSAAVAPGIVAVEGYGKPVQHLEGGVVQAIHVHDGERVDREQLLVTLDDVQARAQYELVHGQYFAALAREARLLAQRDGRAAITWGEELAARRDEPRVRAAIATQQEVLRTQRAAFESDVASVRERHAQLRLLTERLAAQKRSREEQVASLAREIDDVQRVSGPTDTNAPRIANLQRTLADGRAQVRELDTQIVTMGMQSRDGERRIDQLQRELARAVAEELAQLQADSMQLRTRLQALEVALARTEIRSSYAGIVHDVSVRAVGEVIAPGQRLMHIVPQAERLLMEVRVSSLDVDRVRVGQRVDVVFPAFGTERVPRLEGELAMLSADSMMAATEEPPYYLGRVVLTDESLRVLQSGSFRLMPGMPVDAQIRTGERTLLEYLVAPLRDRTRLALTED